MLARNRWILLAAAAALAATAGCGRKAVLDTPYIAAIDARNEAISNNITPVPPQPKAPPVDRPFFLDFLLGRKPGAQVGPASAAQLGIPQQTTTTSTPPAGTVGTDSSL